MRVMLMMKFMMVISVVMMMVAVILCIPDQGEGPHAGSPRPGSRSAGLSSGVWGQMGSWRPQCCLQQE